MCRLCLDNKMAGLHAGHLPLIQQAAPGKSKLAEDLFAALTKTLNPHLPILPALLAMAEAVESKDFGVLAEYQIVRLPLSIIGTDRVRYRTPLVEMLHETILSARMSDLTIEAVRGALQKHGLCIMFLCSCGVVMGKCSDVKSYYGSPAHTSMDLLRSAIDAAGNPVKEVPAFADINVPTMDLHANGAEGRLFDRIALLTQVASQAGHTQYGWIDAALHNFVAQAQTQTRMAA